MGPFAPLTAIACDCAGCKFSAAGLIASADGDADGEANGVAGAVGEADGDGAGVKSTGGGGGGVT